MEARANAISAYGCTIDPIKPRNEDGRMIANGSVLCTTNLQGRTVITELHQQRGDGSWKVVPGASAILEVPERLDDDSYPADGDLVSCKHVSGYRTFKTVIMVGDGNGNFDQTESNSDEFHKDCLAGEPQVVSEADDEVTTEGCQDEVCAEQRLETQARFYGCSLASRIPFKGGSRLIGEGLFACTSPVAKRLLYVKVCDDVSRLTDLCLDFTSRYLNRTGDWTGRPVCPTMPVHNYGLFQKYQGSYSQAGIDPERQGDSNPEDRHANSPRAKYAGVECEGF